MTQHNYNIVHYYLRSPNSNFFTIYSSEKQRAMTFKIFYFGGEYFGEPCKLLWHYPMGSHLLLQVSSNRKFLDFEDIAEVDSLGASDGNKTNI